MTNNVNKTTKCFSLDEKTQKILAIVAFLIIIGINMIYGLLNDSLDTAVQSSIKGTLFFFGALFFLESK